MSGKSRKTGEEKMRNNYSFSLRRTDSPIIREFIEKQTNYSESLRYLIMKFVRENGVQDISWKLNDLMYFPDYLIDSRNDNNVSLSNADNTKEINDEKAVLEEEKQDSKYTSEQYNSSKSDSENTEEIQVKDDSIILDGKSVKDEEEDDIPSCYE